MPDHDVASRRAGRIEDAQRIVHQRPDLVAAIRGERRRRIATNERRDHPPAGLGEHRRQLAPTMGCIREPVQAQRDRGVLRPPRQNPQLHLRCGDVEVPGSGIRRAGTRRSATSSTFSIVARRLMRCRWWFLADDDGLIDGYQYHGMLGSADTDAAAGIVATAAICFCFAPGITTSSISDGVRTRGARRSAARVHCSIALRRWPAYTTISRRCCPWLPPSTPLPERGSAPTQRAAVHRSRLRRTLPHRAKPAPSASSSASPGNTP